MLVQQHHAEQRHLARTVVAELSPLWLILDFHNLKGTAPAWLKATRPIIEKGYLTSQYVAAQFVKNYRNAQLPAAPPLELEIPNPYGPLGLTDPAPKDIQIRIMTAMQVTGPVWIANNSKPGMTVEQIPELMQRAFSKTAGSATRLVLNGGRGMVRTYLDADPQAVGIRSVLSQDSTCRTCSSLASMRLYKTKNSKKQLDAVAVGHDFCTCSAVLLYK